MLLEILDKAHKQTPTFQCQWV